MIYEPPQTNKENWIDFLLVFLIFRINLIDSYDYFSFPKTILFLSYQ